MSSSIRIVREAPVQGWNEANGGDEHVGASSDIRRLHSHRAHSYSFSNLVGRATGEVERGRWAHTSSWRMEVPG
jgi:hypothetical protein